MLPAELNMILEGDLKSQEGYSSVPYWDTLGNLSVGYGCNLDSLLAQSACRGCGIDYANARKTGVTQHQAECLLVFFMAQAVRDAVSLVPGFWGICDGAQRAFANMSYNIGRSRLSKFHNLIAALDTGNYTEAARQMVDSDWYVQIPDRARVLVGYMESCK